MLNPTWRAQIGSTEPLHWDGWLLGAAFLLLALGLLMVASASAPLSETQPF